MNVVLRRVMALVLGFALCVSAQASPVFTGLFGSTAIRGYDPVAYFTDGMPVRGSKQFWTEWNGATWRFASQEHLDLFKATPEQYAPQYGGYCAYAIAAENDLVSSDPQAWSFVDGRLFLNYDLDIQKTWIAKQSDYIKQDDQNWVGLSKK